MTQSDPPLRVAGPTRQELREIRGHVCNIAKNYPYTADAIRNCVTRIEKQLSGGTDAPLPAPPCSECKGTGVFQLKPSGLWLCDRCHGKGKEPAADAPPPAPLSMTLTEDEIEGLRRYVEWNGAAHWRTCPKDDTCDCRCKPWNDAVNSILSRAFDAQVRLVAADAPPSAPQWDGIYRGDTRFNAIADEWLRGHSILSEKMAKNLAELIGRCVDEATTPDDWIRRRATEEEGHDVTAGSERPMTEEIPRRICLDRSVPAELAIRAAVDAVEALPADVRLTDAVVLLGQARERVADFVDRVRSESVFQLCPHGGKVGACSWCDLRDDGGLPESQPAADAPPCELAENSPDCVVHDERCDWVEYVGWRCPQSGAIVTKTRKPAADAPPPGAKHETPISTQDAIRDESHEPVARSNSTNQSVGEGERRQRREQIDRTDTTGSVAASEEIASGADVLPALRALVAEMRQRTSVLDSSTDEIQGWADRIDALIGGVSR